MLRVFLSHTPEMRAGYYPPRAEAALRDVAEVVLHAGQMPLAGRALAEAARGCHCIVADRATAGNAETIAWRWTFPPSLSPPPPPPACW